MNKRSWFGVLAISATAAALLAGAGAAQPASSKPGAAQPGTKTPAHSPSVAGSLKIGDAAPDFTLTDTDGKEHKLSKYLADGKIVVLEWFNPDCPVCAGHYTSSDVMNKTAKAFKDKNVIWLAVNSGGVGKQGNGVERNAKARTDWKIEFPVLLDESGTVGRAYGAKTTPHMFIIADSKLAYKGDITDKTGETNFVSDALTQIIAKETVTTPETESHGCGVKYGEPKKSN